MDVSFKFQAVVPQLGRCLSFSHLVASALLDLTDHGFCGIGSWGVRLCLFDMTPHFPCPEPELSHYLFLGVVHDQGWWHTFTLCKEAKCLVRLVENSSSLFFQMSCTQGILNTSRMSYSLLSKSLVYMYLSQLMRAFTNYLKCIVFSS